MFEAANSDESLMVARQIATAAAPDPFLDVSPQALILRKDQALMAGGLTENGGAAIVSAEVFDKTKALEMTDGDTSLLAEMIALFKQESDELMGQLESSLASGSSDAIRKAAHRLKGAAASVGGARVAAIARTLETAAATGTLADANSAVAQLRASVEEFCLATDGFERESH